MKISVWLTIVTVSTPPSERSSLSGGQTDFVLLLCMLFFQEEQPIYDAFSQEEFLSKFISFLSLEDRKGKDKFNVHRFVLFKVREEISVVGYLLNNK